MANYTCHITIQNSLDSPLHRFEQSADLGPPKDIQKNASITLRLTAETPSDLNGFVKYKADLGFDGVK